MRRHILLMVAMLAGAIAEPARAEVRYIEDATLRSVQFVDANEGWAVGDEGVILHTINGGKTWEPQASGVRGSLRSVCYLSPYRGEVWVAGREELPGGRSMGILLSSVDGGGTWRRQLTYGLPGLNVVRFTADRRVGFLLGDGCDAFASGVFRTWDAGKHWEPLPGPRASSWFAGEFGDASTGIMGGAWSGLAKLSQNVFSVGEVDRLDGRRAILGMNALPHRLLAVGQGGLILSSDSGGKRWGEVDTKMPLELRASIDFHAVHSVGPRVWAVGRPGSIVLASEDEGVNWQRFSTGQTMPLHGLHFIDQRGWAVGEAGTILYTCDGGKSWTIQRKGAERAAILCVHALPDRLDVDTLARLGADEGNLTVALRCTLPPAGSAWHQATAAQRFAAGTRLAGGMSGETLWQFPLPQYLAGCDRKRILEYWNDLYAGEADRHVLRQLVLALRLWRPSVVIGDALHPPISGSQASSLIGEALQAALVQSSDPQVFPEQIEQLGLRPWRASRYYVGWIHPRPAPAGPAGGLAAKPQSGSIVLDATRVSDRLEQSYREFASPARRLLADSPDAPPLRRWYRLLGNAPDVKDSQVHMLEGLPQALGQSLRQPQRITIKADDLKRVRDLSNYVLLAEKIKNPDQFLAQLGPMLDSVSDEHGLAAVLNVADHFARQGQWLLAREAYLLMVQKYPTMPQSAEAYRWLIQHAGSSEARRRHELGQFALQTSISYAAHGSTKDSEKGKGQDEGGVEGENGKKGTGDMGPRQPITRVNYAANPNEARYWNRGGVEFASRVAAYGPMYALDPSLQFCVQSSRRQLGEFEPVKDYFTRFVNFFPRGPWHDAANTELMLMGRGGTQAKPVVGCRFTAQKPLLDGEFNDPCWQGLKPMVLQNAAGDTAKHPTQAWLAFDQTYLYLALRCEHPAGGQAAPVKNRKHDAELTPFDRVSILLDLDRDYATCFHLQIDQRGCVREDCWGDSSWNPKWFVAVKSMPGAWCIEAALPLAELTGEPIVPNTAWACNVVRIVPGRGVQAWSLPADVVPRPEGMGILQFGR